MQKVGASLSNRGFTIVELLIVIVIIGILASLVIIAYSGIQDRANNQQTESAVNAYRKALVQYATNNGSYPVNATSCLGEPAYTSCWPAGTNATFNNAIRPYLGNTNPLPRPSTQLLTYIGTRAGGGYMYDTTKTIDGQPHYYYIVYVLKGLGKCTLPGLLSGPWTGFSSTSPASKYTETSSGNSLCAIALPSPTTL
ncbi:hypothetical protein A3F64_02435 [Candidatus Saccharibacteria bacterium RIFCSPHIGHO2_12_FULL_42_8]|nr:MAG: hypothetical protein A3F64_02435 [Candidatus Saccharibacteria bacterium RIFCSPHIGHO2_12_FULL_42_8]